MKGSESHHIFLWKLGTTVYYSPSLITLVNDVFISFTNDAFISYYLMIPLHNLCKYHWIENDNLQHICMI